MKSSKELKKKLHEYIDRIDDDETLWMVHEDVVAYLKKEKSAEYEKEDLTEEEISEIKAGLQQIEMGETVDWKDYQKATSRWHTK